MLFSHTGDWRPSINGISFKHLAGEESLRFKVPFSEEDFVVLFELSWFSPKYVFSLAFWKPY